MLLEVPLAGLAAEHADDASIAVLIEAIDDARGHDPAGDEFRLADARFHRAIADMAGNDLLLTFTSWILDVLQPSLIEHLGSTIDGELVVGQHQAIMRAIRRHQRTAAERAMRQHIEYMAELLRSFDASPA
jgi:DNA-binding FadR family transcriptional regulator